MKRTNKIIIGVILIAVMLLGIGYAAIQNVTLNIKGTATADPSQSNFNVKFSGTPTVSDPSNVVAAITNDTNATINVSGLTAKGQTVTATYTVQNVSSDLSADLSVATTNSNIEYFTLKAELAKTSLVAGEATTLTVTVTLTKTPISEQVNSIIGIQLTATPVEPGQEGTSGSTNGSSQTPSGEGTLAMATNANIGDYIDLGNNIVGTSSTSDDWRILYVEGGTVYAILVDVLPYQTGLARNAGLQVQTSDSSVFKNTEEAYQSPKLTQILDNSVYWNELSNNVLGAVVKGSPTWELFKKSYEMKTGSTLDGYSSRNYDYDDLYFIGKDYWLASDGVSFRAIYITSTQNGSDATYDKKGNGIRPVVELPSTTKANLENGVWKISK